MARRAAGSAHACVGVRARHAQTALEVSKTKHGHVDMRCTLTESWIPSMVLLGSYGRWCVERSMTGACQHVPVSSVTPNSENENGVLTEPLIS